MFDFSPCPTFTAPQPVRTAPHAPLQQSDLWLEAADRLGSDARLDRIGDATALVLRKRVPMIGELALVSRARLELTPDRAAALRTTLGASHLVINAETTEDACALAQAGFHRIVAPRMIAELRLAPTPDAMAARLMPKWRNRLRHGQSQGLQIRRRPMQADPKHWLLRAEARQSARLWYHPMPPEVIAALAGSAPGAGQVFTAYHLGRRVAAMLFLRHGRAATYQIGWMNAQGRNRSAGPALMWRAMVELQQMGVETIDLGAADPDRAAGLARFKRGTGAELRALGGSWLDTTWARRKRGRARARAVANLRGTQHGHLLATATAPFRNA
ncbi:GNAT family N-acetyltransferase [Gymnodinialimonas ulvae]|uniref:GNAT family N-acetyltransferase n=1 Tax=Gymnodinialimonas ulvae TaxID=3126504 RepID=UPI0030AE0578